MVANSVVSNRQARLATKAYLKRKLALPLTEAEEKCIAHLTARDGVATASSEEQKSSFPDAPSGAEQESTGPLSTKDWDDFLIGVLQALKGRARKPDAEAEAYRRMKTAFDQHYQHPVGEGIPAWKKQFQFAWDRAKKRGYGEPPEKVGHGMWQLTQKGSALAARKSNGRYE